MHKRSIILKSFFILFLFFYTSSSHAQDITPYLIQAQNSQHPLVQKALNQECIWRTQSDYEIQNLLHIIQQLSCDYNFTTVQQEILKKIEKDTVLAQEFTKQIHTYNGNEKIQIPVKSHKIIEILDGTYKLIQQYGHELFNGIIPQEYTYNNLYPPILNDTNNAFGTSKATFVKTALLYYVCAFKKCKNFSLLFPQQWYDSSSLVMLYTVPHSIALDPTWSFFISDGLTPHGILIPHNGYAYGGHRAEPRYPQGQLYGTQDCSSWISKLLELDTYITTRDLLYAYRMQTHEYEYVPDTWKTSPQAKTLQKHLTAYPITSAKDIKEGMIFCSCTFSDKDTLHTGIPIAGHVTIIIHPEYKNKIITLGYNRDMPHKEGFGLEFFNQTPDKKQKYMFFTKN